jgi:hypothetical protein
MILGTLWIPLVGFMVYYRWKNSVKFYVVEFDGTKQLLGNVFKPQWKSYDLLNVVFEENFETYSYYIKGVNMKWPLDEPYVHQWINRAYLKKNECMSVVSDVVKAASGPGKHFGSEFNFQWLFGEEGELVIVCYDNTEIKIDLSENKEMTDHLKNYKVNLEKVTTTNLQLEDWSVC